MKFVELFYVANIIDYARVLFLYWAVTSPDGTRFAAWYSGSYLLDCVDGYAARALGQESRLGYYLDMVIDRVSSCLCLHFAALAVLKGDTVFGSSLAPVVALVLRALIIIVEIVAHGVVVFYSEVLGVHQKKMGYDWWIVQKYLSDKKFLFWGCASFETFGLGLILNMTPVVILSSVGFLFRAAANICRLISVITNVPESQSRKPSRGSLDETPSTSPRSARLMQNPVWSSERSRKDS
jgi:phosphatidylglycerophosphate synthase